MSRKYRTRVYTLWTYDVWGNAREGYEVNDRSSCGEISIRCKREICNPGTPQEFLTYYPTDLQLSRAINARGLAWDGESDYTLYAERKSDGRPEGELQFERFADEG